MSENIDGGTHIVLDKAINLDIWDPLGTKAYSDAIFDIITSKTDNDPMTIGLFGSWGSGKSSIVDTVKARLEGNDEIGVMYYDAWKYSNDAFRRSFIFELQNEFNLNMSLELETFYQDKTEEIDHSIKFKEKGFLINLLFVAAPIICTGSYVLYKAYKNAFNITDSFYIGALGLFISLLSYLVKESLIEYKVSVTKPKIFSPEQFEEVFKNAIFELTKGDYQIVRWFKGIIGRKKYKKILVIIDNIDRCHKDLSMELLLTIKNFIEIENCIFLIPIDEEALKEQLGYNNNEGEEFLRKFFNITLRIKKFTTRNLREFTKELIDENNFGFSYKVADIISQEFSKNPRRIKQFLNNLYAEIVVAKSQEANGFISSEIVTGNIEFLAKVLIIKEEWPSLYKSINDYPPILFIIDECIRLNLYKVKIDDSGKKDYILDNRNGITGITLNQEQYLFFRRNLNIVSENVESFIRLKNIDLDIPDATISNILIGNWDDLRIMLENNQLRLEKLMDLIYAEYDSAVNKRDGLYETSGFILLNLLFQIVYDEKYGDVFDEIYIKFINITDDKRIINLIPNMDFNHVISYSRKLINHGEKYLRDYIILSIEEKKTDKSLMIQYMESYKDDIQSLSKIQDIISNQVIQDVNFINNFIELVDSKNVANAILNISAILKIIESIENNNNDNNKKLVNSIKVFNKIGALSKQSKEKYILKICPFININNLESQNYWMNALSGFFDGVKDTTVKNNLYTNLSSSFNILNSQFSSYYNNETFKENVARYLDLLCEYYTLVDWNKDEILTYVTHFLNRNEASYIYLKANSVFYNIIDYFKVHQWSFIDSIYSKLTTLSVDTEKNELLNTLILQISKVDYVDNNYKGITIQQLNNIINITFNLFYNNSVTYKENMLKLLNINANHVQKEIYLKISTLSSLEKQKKMLELSKDIGNEEVIQSLINNILSSTKEYSKLNELIIFIKENVQDSSKYLKYSLLELVRSLQDRLEEYEDILRICLDNEKLFPKTDFLNVLNKVEKLLENENPNYVQIGQELVRVIMKIPYKKGYSEVAKITEKYKVS